MNTKKRFPILLSVLFLMPCLLNYLYGQNNIYDRIGIITEHGLHGAVPEENIDLYSGNLTLRYLDITLPGPNGLNLNIWRVYNSKLYNDIGFGGGVPQLQQEPYSWVGMGWIMHMGRVHNPDTELPTIEYPDGKWDSAYLDKYGSGYYVTKDFNRYNKTEHKLYFQDGTVWTFGEPRIIYYSDHVETVRLLTRIENSYGQSIEVFYNQSHPILDHITDAFGRTVTFVNNGAATPKLTEVRVDNCQGVEVTYSYQVGAFTSGHYKLNSFQPPVLTRASTFSYNSNCELTAVNTCFDGTLEFTYDDHSFFFDGNPHSTRVVTRKRIKFVSSGQWETWNYSYPSYENSETGTVVVDGPEYDTNVTFYGYVSSAPWKIGLMIQKEFSDSSYSEAYEWTPRVISDADWVAINKYLGDATAPLIQTRTTTRLGDASSKEEYLYEREPVTKYGLATRVNYYGNNLSQIRNYRTLKYYFEDHNSYESRNLLAYLDEEKQFSHDDSLLKQTQTHYYEDNYYWGAIDWIKRRRAQGELLTWDYDFYYPSGTDRPSYIKITINLPGAEAGTETYEYRYGVLAKIIRPGSPAYTEIDRTISEYDSSITDETNQYGGKIEFQYDNLGRIKKIDFPSSPMIWHDINVVWYQNYALITQNSNVITKYWDGMGRDLGYKEAGDGISLYSRKTLDSEGRVVEESRQSKSTTDPSPYKYLYVLNAAGHPTRIADPLGKPTNIDYSGNVKIVEDAEGRETRFEYAWLPGLVSTLTDAQDREAEYAYDDIGRLLQVRYDNNARIQTYSYDGLDNVMTEDHPETSMITYSYNDENVLHQREWGETTSTYIYNAGNQLIELDTGDETIGYVYGSSGSVVSISSNLGWNRDNITYNKFGSVTHETQYIPGLGSKTLTYTYDGYNVLRSIIYPEGNRELLTTNNTLKMPETVSFNGKSIISLMSYGHGKKPENMTISGTNPYTLYFNRTYNAAGYLNKAELKRGTTLLYDSTYAYDDVGNIHSITSTKPIPSLSATFGYDTLNRLTSVTYTPSGVGRVDSISYTYDHYGNMLSVWEDGQPTPFSKSYLSSNRIEGFGYDDRGNLTSADGKSYFWDNQNRLRQLRDASGQVLGSYLYNERGLRIFALPPAPEINVKQGTQNVPDGGSVSFVCAFGSYIDKTFTIDNTLGSANLVLSGSPYVLLTGEDFSILQQPVSPIPPGGSSSFTVRFQPLSPGDKTGSITIPNNDLDENPYNIALSGANPVPEINIDQCPDGGSVSFASNVGSHEDKTFSIENLGAADLILSGSPIIVITGPNADEFSIQQQPVSPVSPSGSTSFIIRFQPTSMGNKTASIAISNNDSNENPYDITLNGHTPQPEMEIDWAGDGGTYDFGTICIGEWWETAFTIYNYGDANLVLSGNPIVQLQGPDWNHFYVTQQPSSTVPPGQYTTFSIRFTPNQAGLLQASISIANNDADENPYDITIIGTGDPNCPNKIIDKASFTIISPAEGEKIDADTTIDIRWKGAESSKYVKIEYSNDNGSTYKTISERAQNTGLYQWQVPRDFSPSCLLRISDAEGPRVIPEQLIYDFMFKASKPQDPPEIGQFTIHAGMPDVVMQQYRFADISFIPDIGAGMTNMYINSALVESRELRSFIDIWQQLRIQFNLENGTGSVWLDERPIIEGFPLNANLANDSSTASMLSFTSSAPILIWVEDLDVWLLDKNSRILSQEDTGLMLKPLIWEGFNNYQIGQVPAIGGWAYGKQAILDDSDRGFVLYEGVFPRGTDSPGSEHAKDDKRGICVDGREFVSGPRSLKIDSSEWPVQAEKRISLPDKAPFGINEGSFAIVAGAGDQGGKPDEETTQELRNKKGRYAGEREYIIRNRQLFRESSRVRMATRLKAGDRARESSGSSGGNDVKILSASPAGSYYIYSYDGKLLAEYNTSGQWVRDYIYVGNQLIAEYRGGPTYYYYASDQINSTRVVTDNSGVVVYSAAYDPFGWVQKTWEPITYTPTMGFSGKERDVESGLDYFGARYHAYFYYRWLSVDPIINRQTALTNPQLWNLYSFCHDNPVTYFDPDGREVIYRDLKLQVIFESLAAKSTMIRETLALYQGEGAPDLIIEYGDPGKENDLGSFRPDLNPVKYDENIPLEIVMEAGDAFKDLGEYSLKSGAITINSGLFNKDGATKKTARHELGHADSAARNTRKFIRQADKDKNLPYEKQRNELDANAYARQSKKRR